MKKIIQIFSFSLFISTSTLIYAQSLPVGADSGPQAGRYQKEITTQEKQVRIKPVGAQDIQVAEAGPENATAFAFILKELKITGNTVYKSEDLGLLAIPYINKTITEKEINQIMQKLKNIYKHHGYLSVLVYLPQQDIKDGVLEIGIIEGRLGVLKSEGKHRLPTKLVSAYFHTPNGEILNFNRIQRDVMRLNQSSDMEIKTYVSAGKKPGTSDITLKINEKFPWHVGGSVDNLGSRYTGKIRFLSYIRSSNMSGRMDSIFLSNIYTGRAWGKTLIYNRPVGTNGTKVGIDITHYTMRIGKEFKANDIDGSTQIYNPHVSWELFLNEQAQGYLQTGLEIKSIKKKISGALIANDQLRTPYVTLDLARLDPYGRTQFTQSLFFGTSNFLGSSSRNHPTASRPNTGGEFVKYEQNLNRSQRLPLETYATLNVTTMMASHTLPASEQLDIGGLHSVRGYPEGDYLADVGAYGQLEWYFPMVLIPKDFKLRDMDVPLRNRIEPFLFIDAGGGKLKKVQPGEEESKFLSGTGGGLRLRLMKNANCLLSWAKYLGDKPHSGNGPATFNFSFQFES